MNRVCVLLERMFSSQAWWLLCVILSLEWLRQENCSDFEEIQEYKIIRSLKKKKRKNNIFSSPDAMIHQHETFLV